MAETRSHTNKVHISWFIIWFRTMLCKILFMEFLTHQFEYVFYYSIHCFCGHNLALPCKEHIFIQNTSFPGIMWFFDNSSFQKKWINIMFSPNFYSLIKGIEIKLRISYFNRLYARRYHNFIIKKRTIKSNFEHNVTEHRQLFNILYFKVSSINVGIGFKHIKISWSHSAHSSKILYLYNGKHTYSW